MPHPLVREAPHGALWRRGGTRYFDKAPRAHGELVVLMGLKGSATYLLDGDVLPLRPGGMIWALAGQRHMLLAESGGFDMWVYLISPMLWRGEAAVPLSLGPGHAKGLRNIGTQVQALAELSERVARTETADLRGDGLRWLMGQARTAWEAADPVRGLARVHPAVARAVALVEDQPELGLGAIAAESGLSASRLRRVFQSDMGIGLKQYRRRQRLARVDRAVEDGETLLAAAFGAGYGSYAQFFRDFQNERGGASPRDWYRIAEPGR